MSVALIILTGAERGRDSAEARERVMTARSRQWERLNGSSATRNADTRLPRRQRACQLDAADAGLLETGLDRPPACEPAPTAVSCSWPAPSPINATSVALELELEHWRQSRGVLETGDLNQGIRGRHPCCRTPAERRPHLVDSLGPAPLAQWQSSGLLIRRLAVRARRGAPKTSSEPAQVFWSMSDSCSVWEPRWELRATSDAQQSALTVR